MRQRQMAWAISLRGMNAFAGVYFFGDDLPTYVDGNRKALFRTRKEARAAFTEKFSGSRGFYDARIVRVEVLVKTINPEAKG